MDVEGHYQKIISNLELGSRALIRFSKKELEELTQIFESAVAENNLEQLEKVLCLVDHNAVDYAPWEGIILKILGQELPP
ncbi:MAG: hypothetical protein H0V66_13760, partial [Bdellovibrionales bacterium]|nr:hypothetical protein [Bdellovibrionales bacterium]